MKSDQTLLSYLDLELKNLNELVDQDEFIREIVDSRIRLSLKSGHDISQKELLKFARRLSDTNIYLMDCEAINETHVQICLTIMSIVMAIDSCSKKHEMDWIPGLRH